MCYSIEAEYNFRRPIHRMRWKKFSLVLLVWIVLSIGMYVLVAEAMLYRLNETYVGTEAAVAMQIKDNALYRSAFVDDIGFLKCGIVTKKKPDIIALGSSRVWQFREGFFKDAGFYTMGEPMPSMDTMDKAFENVCREYVPKIVIINVDWWWLNPNSSHHMRDDVFGEGSIIVERFYLYNSLYKEIIKNSNVREQLIHPELHSRDLIGNRPTIGLLAATKSEGFRSDGSYQHGEAILHPRSTEEKFKNIYQKIEDGDFRFEPADHIDEQALLKFAALIKKIRGRGCHVVVFLPPFPDVVYQAFMQSEGHRGFVRQFEQSVGNLCGEQSVSFFDFSNIAWLGASDEESIDGIHAGERAYGRIVLQFADDEVLAQYINQDYIEACMRKSDSALQIIPADE